MTLTFLDGALGSNLMRKGGESVALLNRTDPQSVVSLHRQYIEAGSQIICTNTFGVNRYSCDPSEVRDLVGLGVELAREAVGDNSEIKVALDVGPLSELLEPYGDLEVDDCAEQYREIIAAGMEKKPDCIFFETFMDIEMLEISVKEASQYDIPILCSMSFTEVGRTIMGNSVQQMCERLEQYSPMAIGMNCSMEPALSVRVATEFRNFTNLPIIFKPNAGKPRFSNGEVSYEDAEIFANECRPIVALENVFIGGCCGSTPDHIKTLCQLLQD